jgi:hypothetical protein
MFSKAEAVNLLDAWYGKSGKGDKFPVEFARASAKKILTRLLDFEGYLFLGKHVAATFGVDPEPMLSWRFAPLMVNYAVVPHPSGVNRWYNDALNRAKAEQFLRKAFQR